jgi:hypothetical protein
MLGASRRGGLGVWGVCFRSLATRRHVFLAVFMAFPTQITASCARARAENKPPNPQTPSRTGDKQATSHQSAPSGAAPLTRLLRSEIGEVEAFVPQDRNGLRKWSGT